MDDPSSPDARGWALWKLPAKVVTVVLAVEAGAMALVVARASVPTLPDVGLAAFLATLSVVHTELATGIERARRRAAETSYFDLSSVWTFAAALLLPPLLAAAVIGVVYLHLWQRVWRPARVPLYRHVYTTATVLLAAGVARGVVQAAGGLPSGPEDVIGVVGVGLAVLLYVLVNTVLVAAAIAFTRDRPASRDLIGRWDDNALEVATICMGALAAVALGSTPGLVALVLPPILVLHRAVLVRQLEEEASTDSKTGLLNAAAWQTEASRTVRRLHRSGGSAAVLILDLDHFKMVNDAYGHLAGDVVLAAVAAELRAGVREPDIVGRFGGEEFVVLLPDLANGAAGQGQMYEVAERVRKRVAALDVAVRTPDGGLTITGVTVSVGAAAVPGDGTTLEQVMKAADVALYAAKRDGRNVVRVAAGGLPIPDIPAPRQAS
ncbi:GGDEF domain-containing protein [Pseudonocardia aurantiaca]|uniref:GGDEF domain-containing protein n=1 Tax=Pseudonocardia aurantiaca TaxID=75290 RepID=A0ABW4FGS6_9PSEU